MKTEKAEVKCTYYDDGQLQSEQYYVNNKFHNPQGPAIKYYHDNEQLLSEEYYMDGKFHNPNGPAVKYWDKNGKLEEVEYFINGKKLTKEQFDNRSANSCEGKVVEIEGKKYKLVEV